MKHSTVLIFFILKSLVIYSQDVFEAARKGNIQRMEELARMDPDTLNSYNESGFTPLIIAGYRGQMDAVRFLLAHRVNVNAGSPEGPALLGACYKADLELARLLIEHGADVNAQNESGTSALILAVLSKNTELVKLLLSHGANKHLAEKSMKTPLNYAKQNNLNEIAALLED